MVGKLDITNYSLNHDIFVELKSRFWHIKFADKDSS